MTPLPAVQLYTIRDAIAADRAGALARLADLGFREVELYGFLDDAAGYRRDLEAAGLTAVSGHARLVDADPAPALDAAAELGLRFLVEPAGARDEWGDADRVADVAAQLGAAAAAAPAGVRVGYHNHDWEIRARIEGRPALEWFVDRVDPAIVLEVDAYWVEAGGVAAVDLLRRLGSRVALVHVKDGEGTADVLDQVAAGSGTLDVGGVLDVTPGAVHILELDAFRGDPFDALRDGLRWIEARA